MNQRPGWLAVVADRAAWAALALTFLALYVYSLLPTVAFYGDTPRFQTFPALWDVNSPPGAPLYTFISQAFLLLPFGDVAYRLNLMSAFFATLSLLLLFQLLRHLDYPIWIAFLATGTFGLGKFFWEQAITAELYTIHTAFLLAVTLLFWLWTATRRYFWLYAGLGLYALSFGNHLGMLLLLPSLLYWLVVHEWRLLVVNGRFALAAGASALLGAAQYLFVYWRGPTSFYGDAPRNWPQFVHFVTGGDFKHLLTWPAAEQLRESLGLAGAFLSQHLYAWGLLLAIAGFWSLQRRRPHYAVFLIIQSAIHLLFGMIYQINDPEIYFMPMTLALIPFLAEGLSRLHGLAQRRSPTVTRALQIAAVVLLALLPLWLTFPRVNLRGQVEARVWLDDFLTDLEPNSVIHAGTLNRWNVLAHGLWVKRLASEAELLWIYRQQEGVQEHFGRRPIYTAGNDFWLWSHYVLDPPPPPPLAVMLDRAPLGHIVVLSSYDDASLTLDQRTIEALARAGIVGDLRGRYREAHLAIGVQGSTPGSAKESLGPGLLYTRLRAGQEIGSTGVQAPVDIAVRAAGLRRGIGGQIYVNGRNVAPGVRGYNVAVIEPDTGRVTAVFHRDVAVGLNVDSLTRYRIVGRWQGDEIELAGPEPEVVATWRPPDDGVIRFADWESRRYLGRGWGEAESWGVWTISSEALLYLHLVPENYRLRITAMPFAVAGRQQSIRPIWNGLPLSQQVFQDEGLVSFDWLIPAELVAAQLNKVALQFDYAVSPREATGGESPDERTLAVWLVEMSLSREPTD
jgi:hypothetical protein